MSSQSHRQALIKALDDIYVPAGTSRDNVAAMIHQVIRGHRINFCDDELPIEGRSHNKALNITVVCREKVVNRVLVDEGSGLNIFPLSMLTQLRFDLGKLEHNQSQRESLQRSIERYVGSGEFDHPKGSSRIQCTVLSIGYGYNL